MRELTMKKDTTKETVLGKVLLNYKDDGSLLTASFTPNIHVSTAELLEQFGTCANKTVEQVQETAQLVLASFFNRISDIELRDMETTDIEAKVVNTTRYTHTSDIKAIEIDFIYKEK
jgi:hypothetical protein